MANPRIRKIDRIGSTNVYEVNGKLIRDTQDKEFTNWGVRETNKIVPENEIWLDKEAAPDEHRYFIDNAMALKRHIKGGVPRKKAQKLANSVESRERNKFLPGTNGTKEGVYKSILPKADGKPTICIVHGDMVRKNLKTDFTEGGHGLVYDFIPKDQVWIDDDIGPDEVKFVLLHELHERNLMRKGISYDKAHLSASKLESMVRERPEDIDEYLGKALIDSKE